MRTSWDVRYSSIRAASTNVPFNSFYTPSTEPIQFSRDVQDGFSTGGVEGIANGVYIPFRLVIPIDLFGKLGNFLFVTGGRFFPSVLVFKVS